MGAEPEQGQNLDPTRDRHNADRDHARLWRELRKDPVYVQAVANESLASFKVFCLAAFKFVYRKDFIWSEHHATIATALMRVWAGLDQNLVINLPPRYSKTEMMCLFAAWSYAHNPRCEFLHLSYSAKLAAKNSNKVRNMLKSAFFKDCFGDLMSRDIDSAGEWATKEGGIFKADSANGQVTGFGAGATNERRPDGSFEFAGCLLIDDPLKPSDAHTVERDKVNANWDETIKSRRNNPGSTPTICIMQRIHEGDFTAHLLGDSTEQFRLLSLKALRDDNTALWPAKHTVEMLERMRDSNTYVFSGQYQQEPTPRGGTIFKADWWQFCAELPKLDYVCITADTALKTKEHNDFSVFQAWGYAGGKIYLVDQLRGKWESLDLERVAVGFINRIKSQYTLRKVYIEDKASGTHLIQTIARKAVCVVAPVQRNVDKVTRAFDAAPHVQAGSVVLLEGASYVDMFVSECTSFNAEMTHLHDDQIDPMMDAVAEMLGNVNAGSGILVY